MELDIYDFDKTIVPFDSGSLFSFYCLLHYPWTIVCLLPIAINFVLMSLGIISFTNFKKTCFMYVPLIPLDKAVKKFWDKHEKEIHSWFLNRKRDCVVISASPDFLLEEIAERASINRLLCTRHNRKTGVIIGENCRGDEKVRRFREIYPDARVIDVYSDSFTHDRPIFSLADGQCYHVNNSVPEPFDFNEKYGESKIGSANS